jgi:DNA-binding MarR family transcriptional regulator
MILDEIIRRIGKENIIIRENIDKREKRIKLTDKGKEIILKIIDLEQLGVFIR